jgi:beta-lactamase class A
VIRWRSVWAGIALAATAGVVVVFRLPAYEHKPAHARWAAVGPVAASIEDRSPAPSPTGPSSDQPQGPDRDQAHQRDRREAELRAALARYEKDESVDLALVVVDRNTGRAFSYHGDRHFGTASIVKVDILATLLLQAESSGRPLTESEKRLATAMIEESDNDAATTLWNRTGGISGSAAAFGLTQTTPGPRGLWGGSTTTAEDQARLITALAGPGSPIKGADYVFGLMRNVDDEQAWGISAAAEQGEVVALKNGWIPDDAAGGRWLVNSMGRITGSGTDVTMVVLSGGHGTFEAGVGVVEAVATLARLYLGW